MKCSYFTESIVTPKPADQLFSLLVEAPVALNHVPLKASWKLLSLWKEDGSKSRSHSALKFSFKPRPVAFWEIDAAVINRRRGIAEIEERTKTMELAFEKGSTVLVTWSTI